MGLQAGVAIRCYSLRSCGQAPAETAMHRAACYTFTAFIDIPFLMKLEQRAQHQQEWKTARSVPAAACQGAAPCAHTQHVHQHSVIGAAKSCTKHPKRRTSILSISSTCAMPTNRRIINTPPNATTSCHSEAKYTSCNSCSMHACTNRHTDAQLHTPNLKRSGAVDCIWPVQRRSTQLTLPSCSRVVPQCGKLRNKFSPCVCHCLQQPGPLTLPRLCLRRHICAKSIGLVFTHTPP